MPIRFKVVTMPVSFKVVSEDGRSTREPTNTELPHILAFMQPFIKGHGDGPLGLWNVPGVGEVSFSDMGGNGHA